MVLISGVGLGTAVRAAEAGQTVGESVPSGEDVTVVLGTAAVVLVGAVLVVAGLVWAVRGAAVGAARSVVSEVL